MVKNPPPSDAGGMGSIPGQGTKIPHATGQFSPGATTKEDPVRCREKPVCHNDSVQPKKGNMFFLYVLFFSKFNSKLECEWQPLLREKTTRTPPERWP